MLNMKISIVFLLFNGLSDHFEETLSSVRRQCCLCDMEMIAIDSGSTDGTVEFVKKQNDIILHEISNDEFGHGRTRQMGVRLSQGEYIVFLTQDATPRDNQWLSELVRKIESDREIVAVSSRISPREDAMLIRKYNVLSEWCASDRSFVIDSCEKRYRLHDISTIYRREFLEEFNFDDVEFGEDVLIAKKALQNGFKIAFCSGSVVLHSHNYDIIPVYRRNVVDGEFNRRYLQKNTVTSISHIFKKTYFSVKKDVKRILKEEVFLKEKFINIFYSPIIHFCENLGQYKGNKRT